MKKVEENKLQKKNALLQSSFDLFVNDGFSKTTISEIVKKAGLAKGTFYLYFKDKYDLRDKLITHKTAQLFEEVHQAIHAQSHITSFEDLVLFICDFFIERFEEDPKLLHFISKNLSWGIYKNVLEQDASQTSSPFIEDFKEHMANFHAQCDQLDFLLFTIIELVSASSHSCIIYHQPSSMQEYQPYLHKSVLAILDTFIRYEG